MGPGDAGGSAYSLRTPRLTVRIMGSDDVATLCAYRNQPQVAALQDWEVPYTPEMAQPWLTEQDRLVDLDDGWTELAIDLDGVHIGEIPVELTGNRAQANIGFSLGQEHWGHGYAQEAALAVLADLVERVGVVRVTGDLDPRNTASARVLEAIGLVYSHDAAASFFWRGDWVATRYYQITAQQWRAWRDRPVGEPDSVELVPIDETNVHQWRAVETHHSQRRFVAPVDDSYADALRPEVWRGGRLVPVLFGVVADGEPAGFVMVAAPTAAMPVPYLWRFLVDRRNQGRGIGRRAMVLLGERLHTDGHSQMWTTVVDGQGGPQGFYLGLGGTLTGDVVDGEKVIEFTLAGLIGHRPPGR